MERKIRESNDKIKKNRNDAKTDHKKNSKRYPMSSAYLKRQPESSRVLYHSCYTLSQQLFKLKDKADPLKQADDIYNTGCKYCELSYIGETIRPLYIRQK